MLLLLKLMKTSRIILILQLFLILVARNGMAISRHACSMSGEVMISLYASDSKERSCGSCCTETKSVEAGTCCSEDFSFVQCEEDAESVRLSHLLNHKVSFVYTLVKTSFAECFKNILGCASQIPLYFDPPVLSGREVMVMICILRI